MKALNKLDLEVAIWTMPQEMSDPIPFELDDRHTAYDRESAHPTSIRAKVIWDGEYPESPNESSGFQPIFFWTSPRFSESR